MKKRQRKKKVTHSSEVGSGARVAVLCLGMGALLVLFCSCLSFDIADWPSRYVYPHNQPTANWCGKMGAFGAYWLLYYIGPGVFTLLTAGMLVGVVKMLGRSIGQLWFRLVGLVLLTVAVSVTFYCLWPHGVFEFPTGSGGVLGVTIADFLSGQFGALGMFILVMAMWAVGLLLVADAVVIAAAKGTAAAAVKTVEVAAPAAGAMARHSGAVVKAGGWLAGFFKKLKGRPKLRIGGLGRKKGLGKRSVGGELARAKEPSAPQAYEPPLPDVDAGTDAELEKVTGRAPEMKTRQVKPPQPKKDLVQPSYEDYKLPPLDMLLEPEYGYAALQEKVVKSKASALECLLGEFNVNAQVVAAETGPVVTLFELQLGAGVKVSQITNLSNDMARALGVGAVRVVAPLPGKHTIGIEVPNSEKEKVRIKSMMELAGDKPSKMHLPLFLGKDSQGESLVSDLTKMPHLLIAGTTGSGKSVCINSIIVSVLMTKRPDEVKMILIDPKMVEMTAFNTIPHLMCPIVTETAMAVKILEWATVKMDERYAVLAEARVKNIAEFNQLGTEEILKRFNPSTPEEEAQIPKKLPYFVIIIDELADLMMTAAKEIEAYIVRLAQKSRAVGIHIVLATQRPQATVVTGLIKSNMPCRIGFRVAARMDSRIILDQNGAETLLGEGDMLFLKPGTSDLVRAQGTLIDEGEIKRIVRHLKDIAEPQFHPELVQLRTVDLTEGIRDDLFDEAVRMVLETKRGSVSLLQRRLSIGYARASRIIEMMASAGILGEYKGSQAREVTMTAEEYEQLREQMLAEQDAAMAEADDGDDEPAREPQPAYVSEGQLGYVATDSDEQEP